MGGLSQNYCSFFGWGIQASVTKRDKEVGSQKYSVVVYGYPLNHKN